MATSPHTEALLMEDEMTKTDKALAIWNQMAPMERFEVMQAVGECKSVTKRFRLCIEHIARGL